MGTFIANSTPDAYPDPLLLPLLSLSVSCSCVVSLLTLPQDDLDVIRCSLIRVHAHACSLVQNDTSSIPDFAIKPVLRAFVFITLGQDDLVTQVSDLLFRVQTQVLPNDVPLDQRDHGTPGVRPCGYSLERLHCAALLAVCLHDG